MLSGPHRVVCEPKTKCICSKCHGSENSFTFPSGHRNQFSTKSWTCSQYCCLLLPLTSQGHIPSLPGPLLLFSVYRDHHIATATHRSPNNPRMSACYTHFLCFVIKLFKNLSKLGGRGHRVHLEVVVRKEIARNIMLASNWSIGQKDKPCAKSFP